MLCNEIRSACKLHSYCDRRQLTRRADIYYYDGLLRTEGEGFPVQHEAGGDEALLMTTQCRRDRVHELRRSAPLGLTDEASFSRR